ALLKVGAPAVDFAIAVSDAVAIPLRTAGVATTVVHNGVAWPVTPAPEPIEHPEGAAPPPIVGCMALLTDWKGQHVLLEAVARLRRRDVIVELAGATPSGDNAYAQRLRR